jgi:hypothetical protein
LLDDLQSKDPEPFHVKDEFHGNNVSPVKAESHAYDDCESVTSSVIHIPNEIKIGTITNLDLFRKERSEEDECNFFLFRKGDGSQKCECTIM